MKQAITVLSIMALIAITAIYGAARDSTALMIIGTILLCLIMVVYLFNGRFSPLITLVGAAIIGYNTQFGIVSLDGVVISKTDANWRGSVFLMGIALILQVIALGFRILFGKMVRVKQNDSN